MEFIVAQIFGAVAVVLVCIGYFFKQKNKLMLIQVVANFFYASAFFVVGAYVGGGLVMISLFRCLYIYVAEKYNFKYMIRGLSIFILLYIVTTVLLWQTAFDIMPLISSILFTMAFIIKDLQLMKYILIIPNSILIFYNILTTTYVSALLDFIEVVVIIIAIIKFYTKQKVIDGELKTKE